MLLLASLAVSLAAAQPLRLPGGLDGAPLGRHLDLLRDPGGALTLQDVAQGPAALRFQGSSAPSPNLGFTKDAVWARLPVQNDSQRPLPFVLEVAYPNLDHIELFAFRNGAWEHRETGRLLPFQAREIKHRTFLFNLEAAPGGLCVYYLRFRSSSSMDLQLAAWSQQGLMEASNVETALLCLFYGIVLAMILFNFIVYLATRDRTYLVLVVAILHMALFVLVMSGMATQFFWPRSAWLAAHALTVVIALANFWIVQFTRSFLETRASLLSFDRPLACFQWSCAVLVPVALFLPYGDAIRILVLFSLFTVGAILATGAVGLARGNRAARIFLAAWAGLILGNGLLSLKTFGILPDIFLTRWSAHIGLCLQVLLISLALVDRMHLLKKNLEALNLNLDHQVGARTRELEEANIALREASMVDPLTGLKNRRFLGLSMPEELARVSRQRGALQGQDRSLANRNRDLLFLMVDLDHFKTVNDTYGHPAGDRMLQQVSEALRQACREADIVVRWGGEEFLVVARNAERLQAGVVAGKLWRAIRELPFDMGQGRKLHKTCSVGFCAFPILDGFPDLHSWEDAVALADQCLYAAKNSGRDGWVGILVPDEAQSLGDLLLSEPGSLASQGRVRVLTSFPAGTELLWGGEGRPE